MCLHGGNQKPSGPELTGEPAEDPPVMKQCVAMGRTGVARNYLIELMTNAS
jgi:hypothetical protein